MKDIPVTGYLFGSDDQDGLHSHQLYITSWDGNPVHIHHFAGETSFDVGHDHRYAGNTEPAPSGVPHSHRYFTFTTVDDGHHHEIQGVTGPAIELPNGGHVHEFAGRTSVSGATPHTHHYSGRTSPSL